MKRILLTIALLVLIYAIWLVFKEQFDVTRSGPGSLTDLETFLL